jgi:hypothetical protein
VISHLTAVKVVNGLEKQSPALQCAWEQSRELRVVSIAQVIAGAVQRFWPTARPANCIEKTAEVASTREDET